MPAHSQEDVTFGFLSVQYSVERGYLGGHLVLSSQGRPIEFRCTAPVQPSRAQQVLYGPTLGAYVCGELIASALLENTKTKPNIVFTNGADNMGARPRLRVPMVCVDTSEHNTDPAKPVASDEPATKWRLDQAHAEGPFVAGPKWLTFRLGGCDVAALAGHESDKNTADQLWSEAGAWIDLAEPFERVHEAIRETMQN